MELNVDQQKVAGVVKELNQVIGGKGFNRLELILGLAEMTGRVVVDTAETPIQARELAGVAFGHLSQTITVGLGNQKSLIERI